MPRTRWLLGALSVTVAVTTAVLLAAAPPPAPRQWHVRPGARGDGSASQPFGAVTEALALATAGDEILVAPGSYREALRTTRGGTPGAPLTVRAARPADRPVFEVSGRVATIAHPHVVLDGLVLDGMYGADDAVRVTSAASGLVLRNVEVRRSSRDCVDMAAPNDVLVERVLIHHCLDASGGRKDAHGIATSAVERLTVRDSEIHTFSGDALQFDPSRAAPAWTDVRLERLKLWLGPLPAAVNGFAAGTVPGENAIDTKTPRDGRRSQLLVQDVEAWGFTNGLVNNMAAFNIKERVDVVFNRVTVHDSDIAFRVRGPGDRGASVTVRDSTLHHLKVGFRYEDDLATLRVDALKVGPGVGQLFKAVASPNTNVQLRR